MSDSRAYAIEILDLFADQVPPLPGGDSRALSRARAFLRNPIVVRNYPNLDPLGNDATVRRNLFFVCLDVAMLALDINEFKVRIESHRVARELAALLGPTGADPQPTAVQIAESFTDKGRTTYAVGQDGPVYIEGAYSPSPFTYGPRYVQDGNFVNVVGPVRDGAAPPEPCFLVANSPGRVTVILNGGPNSLALEHIFRTILRRGSLFTARWYANSCFIGENGAPIITNGVPSLTSGGGGTNIPAYFPFTFSKRSTFTARVRGGGAWPVAAITIEFLSFYSIGHFGDPYPGFSTDLQDFYTYTNPVWHALRKQLSSAMDLSMYVATKYDDFTRHQMLALALFGRLSRIFRRLDPDLRVLPLDNGDGEAEAYAAEAAVEEA
ncbi:VP7 [St Croix River virus]|uniref:VP7 n=1 Tax=St Croix River virus TaxID=104581 RepID=Q9DSP2_9REOV|nr:VP7 [St Croix River virus]AAG34264.1 VP7 [St Croix River virus]